MCQKVFCLKKTLNYRECNRRYENFGNVHKNKGSGHGMPKHRPERKLGKTVSQTAARIQMITHHMSKYCEILPCSSDFHDTAIFFFHLNTRIFYKIKFFFNNGKYPTRPDGTRTHLVDIWTNRPSLPHRGVGWLRPITDEHFPGLHKNSFWERPRNQPTRLCGTGRRLVDMIAKLSIQSNMRVQSGKK